jgi:hypothetical protein
MADEDTRHRIPREEAAQTLNVPLWDLEEAVRNGDIPSIRSGDVIEVPADWITQAAADRELIPIWLRARLGEATIEEGGAVAAAHEATAGEAITTSEGASTGAAQ